MSKWLLGLFIGALFVVAVTSVNGGSLTGLAIGISNAGSTTIPSSQNSLINKLTVDIGEVQGLSTFHSAVINVANDLPANGDELPEEYCIRHEFESCTAVNAYTSQGLIITDCNFNALKGTRTNNLQVCSAWGECTNVQALTVSCYNSQTTSDASITGHITEIRTLPPGQCARGWHSIPNGCRRNRVRR